ncbi:aminotransferase class III-fold pyridoxal phosphate-dependent enzyme [Acidobacteriota bacterium]
MGNKNKTPLFSEHFSPCLTKTTNLLVEKGEGPYLITTKGEKYLDLVQGIAVNALGHSHPAIVDASCKQIKNLIHGSFNLVNFPSTLQLASEMRKITPGKLDMFFFTNSGAETIEASLKLARYISGRTSFIAFSGSFHGRTMGAASITSSNMRFRKSYAPFLSQVYFVPYPYCFRCAFGKDVDTCNIECLNYVKNEFHYAIPPDDVSAVIFEPILGEGGYIVPPSKYVHALREMCDRHRIYLIFDEVQSGMGRTGKMFSGEHYNIVPDILCLGKAVGGGFPLAILASTKENMTKWETGAHGTTFGGHPVAAAAALAQLKILTREGFLKEVEKKGRHFRSRLMDLAEKFPEIGDVRGLGLMLGIEFITEGKAPNPEKAKSVQKYLFEKNILVMTCGAFKQVLRFTPPLNISETLLDHTINVLKDALDAGTRT